MQVHQYTNSLPPFRRAVVTIGTFDGVHKGHLQIIHQLKEEASAIGGETVLITFHPHPRSIVNSSNRHVELITTMDERIELLAAAGVDHLVIVPFTENFSKLSAIEYVEEFLVKHFQPHTVIIGYDHRFGHGRQGDYHLLEDYAAKGDLRLKEIPAELINNNAVSSTSIRKFLLDGNISAANELLSYEYFFEGKIVHGNKIGRTLGYPTANIVVEDNEKLIPANGIYAVRVRLPEQYDVVKGMMSIGIRPTIGGTDRVIEVNILDWEGDLYGKNLRVYLAEYLRPELKFKGLDELKNQLHLDKEETLKRLS